MSNGEPNDVQDVVARIRQKRFEYGQRNAEGSYSLFLNDESICVYDLCSPLFYHGWEAVRTITIEFVDATVGPLDIDSGSPVVEVSGDLACSWSIVRIRTNLKTGHHVDMQMRQTNVWRRVEGQWYIIHEHNSQPLDLEASQKLLGIDPETAKALSE